MTELHAFSPEFQQRVVDLILSIQRDEFGIDITVDDQPDLLDVPGFYQSGAGGFWLAVEGHTVVGTIALRDIGNHQAALRKMFVASAYRGRAAGLAARLLGRLVEHARGCGVQELFLGTTERFEAAHRFYEKNRFFQVAPESLPHAFARMAVDTRFYRRALRPQAAVTRSSRDT